MYIYLIIIMYINTHTHTQYIITLTKGSLCSGGLNMFQTNNKYFKEFGTSLCSPWMANLFETECPKSYKFISKICHVPVGFWTTGGALR